MEVKQRAAEEDVEESFEYDYDEFFNIDKKEKGSTDSKIKCSISQLKDHILRDWKDERKFDPANVASRLTILFGRSAINKEDFNKYALRT